MNTLPALKTPHLQPAQIRLLPLLAAGYSNKQIAAVTGWTPRTAQDQVWKILCALSLDNRAQVGAWAIAVGHVSASQAVALLLESAPHLKAQP